MRFWGQFASSRAWRQLVLAVGLQAKVFTLRQVNGREFLMWWWSQSTASLVKSPVKSCRFLNKVCVKQVLSRVFPISTRINSSRVNNYIGCPEPSLSPVCSLLTSLPSQFFSICFLLQEASFLEHTPRGSKWIGTATTRMVLFGGEGLLL